MSIVLGAVLAHAGWHDLEEQVDRATLLKRIAAAMLMTAAIALYFSDVLAL
jgi:MFS superfamily sulfate permease-like transporter